MFEVDLYVRTVLWLDLRRTAATELLDPAVRGLHLGARASCCAA
jgi:hypothetical protein